MQKFLPAILVSMTVVASAIADAALADEAPQECLAPVTPAGELASWSTRVELSAARDVAGLGNARVHPGQAAELTLYPAEDVRFPAAPGKPGGNGGLAELVISEAGTYRIALGTAAWVDVVSGGQAIVSTAHGHGEKCTGIRKVVEFRLERGRYILAIAGNADTRTQILVVRKF